MDTVWKNGTTATQEQIADFEEIYGVKLPKEYKEILREHNGGTPDRKLFRLPDGTENVISRLIPIQEDYECNVGYATDIVRINTRIPFIAFCSVAIGSYLCFDFGSRNENPEIVFVNGMDMYQCRDYKGIKVCGSFAELLDMLEL